MQSTGYYELDKLPSKCASNYIYCADTNDFRTDIYSVDAKEPAQVVLLSR